MSILDTAIGLTNCVTAITAIVGIFISAGTLYLLIKNLKELQEQNRNIKSSLSISQRQIEEAQQQTENTKNALLLSQEESKEIQKQNFETRLFNLLKRQNEIPESVLGKNTARNNTFKQIRIEFTNLYQQLSPREIDMSNPEELLDFYQNFSYDMSQMDVQDKVKLDRLRLDLEIIKEKNKNKINKELLYLRFCYLEIFKIHKALLSPYFRHFYHILKQITENSVLHEGEKKSYANIIQAGMTNDELFLTYYNSLCFPKVLKLVAKYNFFQNMGQDELLTPEHISFMRHINSNFDIKDKIDLIFPKDDPFIGIDINKLS